MIKGKSENLITRFVFEIRNFKYIKNLNKVCNLKV